MVNILSSLSFRSIFKEHLYYLIITPFTGVIQGRMLEVVRNIDIGVMSRHQGDKLVVPLLVDEGAFLGKPPQGHSYYVGLSQRAGLECQGWG